MRNSFSESSQAQATELSIVYSRDALDEQTEASSEQTVRAAAKSLGKSVRCVQRMLMSGQLKGYKISGPKGPEWRILPQSAEQATQVAVHPAISRLEHHMETNEQRLVLTLRELHAYRVRAEALERKHEETRNEHEKAIKELKTKIDEARVIAYEARILVEVKKRSLWQTILSVFGV